MSLLDRIREKPQHVKGRYAFLGAVVVTGTIGLVWMTSLPAQFEKFGQSGRESSESANSSETSNPLDEFADIFGDAKDQLGNVADTIEESEKLRETVDPIDSLNENHASDQTNEADGVGSQNVDASLYSDDTLEFLKTATDTPEVKVPEGEVIATSTSSTELEQMEDTLPPQDSEPQAPRTVLIATTSSEINEQNTE